MRYFAITWLVIFTLFAALQLNDPDPYLWVPIYLVSVYTSFLAIKGEFPLQILILLTVLYLAGSIFYFPASVKDWIHAEEQAKSLDMKMPFIEEAREAMGLLICAMVNGVYSMMGFRNFKRLA